MSYLQENVLNRMQSIRKTIFLVNNSMVLRVIPISKDEWNHMKYPDPYELLDWASSLGLERKIPVNLSTVCSSLGIHIIQGALPALGSINMNALGQTEIKLNSDMAFTKQRFVTAMLLGHYWQHLGKIKQAEISETYLPKYEVTEINYPYLSFKHDYKECAYSLFASQLVMPSSAVNTRLHLSKGKRPSILKMIRSARDFQVPLNVMIQRIETLSSR